MDNQFSVFLDQYLEAWRASSIAEMGTLISKSYKGREITGETIVDFEFEESINGWEQGFDFVKENHAQWELNVHSTIPLRVDEVLVIISATMVMSGKRLATGNLFFQTFKKDSADDWKLVRSYIEAGIPLENVKKMEVY